MKKKARYKIRNWKEYNQALVNRGSLTFWFDEEVISAWHNVEENKDSTRGRPPVYSDILGKSFFQKLLPKKHFRATEGLLGSLIELMDLPIKVLDYTTLSRRHTKSAKLI